jgi:hypothetical protein
MSNSKQQTKTLLVGAIFLLLCGFSANALADSTQLSVTGTVAEEVSVKSKHAIDGWTFTKSTTGNDCKYKILPNGDTSNSSGGQNCSVIEGANAGKIKVTGAPGSTVSLSYSIDNFGDPGVTLHSVEDHTGGTNGNGGNITLNNGSKTLKMGAKIGVDKEAQSGPRSAAVNITVNYQ